MKDLRLYANDLIGKRVKPKQDKRDQWEGRNPNKYKYVIAEVYRNYVSDLRERLHIQGEFHGWAACGIRDHRV